MAWSIERRTQHVALVTMNTNKANAQNRTFFEDLHRAFDQLEAEFNDCGVVLTGTGRVFSAGLDFDYHFPLFARRSTREVDAWFEAYRVHPIRAEYPDCDPVWRKLGLSQRQISACERVRRFLPAIFSVRHPRKRPPILVPHQSG